MQFHSGFCLRNEEALFGHLLPEGALDICGFSYGAIKAFEEAKRRLEAFARVDRVVLLSPAFFQTTTQAFRKLQLRSFAKDPQRYLKNFLASCFAPYEADSVETKMDASLDLERLLHYQWSAEEIVSMRKRGVSIEVYLGGEDRIIDVDGAYDFFKDVADVTLIKRANHFLQEK